MKKAFFLYYWIIMANTLLAQKDSVEIVNTVKPADTAKITMAILKVKQVCFNITPLASQFIPFNAINPFTTGPVNIGIKIFNNNLAYRFGVGVNLVTNDLTNENLHLNLRNGFEIRKKINEKWYYAHGCDALLSLGNLNLPGNTAGDVTVLIGVAPFWGVEYSFGKNLSLSTETSLLIGIDSNGEGGNLRLQFIPPIALFLNLNH